MTPKLLVLLVLVNLCNSYQHDVLKCSKGTHLYESPCSHEIPTWSEATCQKPKQEDLGPICDLVRCDCDKPTIRDTTTMRCVKLADCPKAPSTKPSFFSEGFDLNSDFDSFFNSPQLDFNSFKSSTKGDNNDIFNDVYSVPKQSPIVHEEVKPNSANADNKNSFSISVFSKQNDQNALANRNGEPEEENEIHIYKSVSSNGSPAVTNEYIYKPNKSEDGNSISVSVVSSPNGTNYVYETHSLSHNTNQSTQITPNEVKVLNNGVPVENHSKHTTVVKHTRKSHRAHPNRRAHKHRAVTASTAKQTVEMTTKSISIQSTTTHPSEQTTAKDIPLDDKSNKVPEIPTNNIAEPTPLTKSSATYYNDKLQNPETITTTNSPIPEVPQTTTSTTSTSTTRRPHKAKSHHRRRNSKASGSAHHQ